MKSFIAILGKNGIKEEDIAKRLNVPIERVNKTLNKINKEKNKSKKKTKYMYGNPARTNLMKQYHSDGWSVKDIAAEFDISIWAVYKHLEKS